MQGYLHRQYAESLADFGMPWELPRAGAWVLMRKLADSPLIDAMGCYPLFQCRNWYELPDELDDLQDQLVSLAVVTDPFGDYTESLLDRAFPEVAQPYKEHFVIKTCNDFAIIVGFS